ncbi:putative CALMODULIN-BINDING PROTEIN60 [Helianthus annuus]|nr:putative CALMODULIN-BINDING PROTEIN60 [Helianthus annuus]KAJ0776329.1 putative CALMODULIN-BINDING PROTEIN60 [Helianthus annuus]
MMNTIQFSIQFKPQLLCLSSTLDNKVIQGNDQNSFLVALVDEVSGQIVTTGVAAAMEVEIVVLEGESSHDEPDNWTSDEFNSRIVKKWNEQNVLKGNTFVKLNEGTVYVDKISFTHNSKWKGKRICRIGARPVNAVFPTRVKEAKTELFLVEDKRNDMYKKHEIPSLSDHLYRLHKISHRSCYKRLSSERVKTVMDLLTLHAINPQRLKDILKVSHKTWKIIMDHANMCKDDKSKGTYLSYYPRNGQKSNGVAFNVSGQLVGIVAESKFVSSDKLPDDKRADAQKLIASSSEHWKEVVSFNDQDLLINHLQQRAILNPLSHNNLNVVIPQTFDPSNHTNLTSPKSQSPKRPASEHASSNSPKQPRYDHPKSSPSSMTSVGMDTSIRREANNLQLPLDDGDISMYLNLDLRDRRWKIVWCAVGWISVMIKLRKE